MLYNQDGGGGGFATNGTFGVGGRHVGKLRSKGGERGDDDHRLLVLQLPPECKDHAPSLALAENPMATRQGVGVRNDC